MTAIPTDYMGNFPFTPTKRIVQGEISSDTKQPRQSLFEFVGAVVHVSQYLTLRWNDASVRGLHTNQLVDVSAVIGIPSENATVKTVVPEEIEEDLSVLVSNIRDQIFDDILESDVAKSLTSIINNYGNIALKLLYTWIASGQIDVATANDLVILIGRIETNQKQFQLEFLERCLRLESSIRVRYASILGLAYLDDRSSSSIVSLKRAIEDEKVESLKKDMLQLLAQLEKPRRR